MLEKILESVDLGALSETLLYGHASEEQSALGASYKARIKAAEGELQAQLGALPLEPSLDDDILEAFYHFLAKANPVYFELGMKAGVALYRNLQGELPAEMKNDCLGEC